MFHFTSSRDHLINILSNEFRPHYCLEDLNVLASPDDRPEDLEVAIPMVCFCDLPLSQTGLHLSVYGDYGIGMSKAWAMRKGITPILYLHRNSLTASRLSPLFNQSFKNHADPALLKELDESLFDFLCFCKPYEGNLWREGGTLDEVRFYDEREWRFVPSLTKDLFMLTKSDFLDVQTRREANAQLTEVSHINFEPNDIKYLIVRREDEIVPLIRDVERIKGKYSHDDVLLLSSRVISAEQIRADF
jgi:hypothetical protein